MNCQEISRIADTGRFGSLTEAQSRAAAAHALSCRHCAPVWAAHARLAELRIPAMPAELALRCRTLAALPVQSRGRLALRRLTLVGGVVALAAAAAVFLAYREGAPAPDSHQTAVTTPAVTEPAAALQAPQAEVPAITEVAANLAPPPEEPKAQTQELPPLPLLPRPVYASDAERNALVDTALQRAAERHPELVQGPEMDGAFYVGVAMTEDGKVITSSVRPVASTTNYADTREASAELDRTLPRDGGSSTNTSRRKHTLLPDGRALRADVTLRVATLPMGFDISRSSVRVLQILGDKYNDQLRPASDSELNRLTVFLSGDGRVLREKIDHVSKQGGSIVTSGDTNSAAFMAEGIANRLELDSGQIGLMGTTTLDDGSMSFVIDQNGNSKPNDQRRLLSVSYAWQRRAGEAGAVIGQGTLVSAQSKIDATAVLAIVERLIPDAFTPKDPAAGQPTVVLTAKGEVIRAGRVNFGKGGAMDSIFQEQFVPGVRTSSFASARVSNNMGDTVVVMLAWEVPKAETAQPTN